MKKYILILVSVLFVGTTAQATKEYTTKNDTIIESTSLSSEIKKERKYRLTIHSGTIIENTSLDYRLFTTGNIDKYKQTISDGLIEQNILSIRSKTGISYSKKAFANKIGYSLGIYDRAEVDFGFSKDLFDLVFFGNEMFMGEKINLNNTYLSATKFQQINIGLSRIIQLSNDNQYMPSQIEVGLGYSHLIGNHHVDFSTNDSYIEMGNDGEYINTNLNFSANIADTNKLNLFGSQGIGHALDLFLNLKKDENNIHFSIADLGNINWNKNAINYTSEKEISFSGVEIDNLLKVTSDELEFNAKAILPQLEKKPFVTLLPTIISFRNIIDEKKEFQPTYRIRYKILSNYFPYFNAGLVYKVNQHFWLKGTAAYGGYSGIRAELGAYFDYKYFRAGIESQNVTGIFMREGNGNGLRLYLNTTF